MGEWFALFAGATGRLQPVTPDSRLNPGEDTPHPYPTRRGMLSIRKLVKVYPGPVTALQGIDLDLPLGMFGLLGPNGAGKTTFMRILAGLLEPTAGEVTLDGEDVLKTPHYLWQRLGYLPQE